MLDEKKEVFPVYKFLGESPLDAVERIKKENNFLKDKKIAYAGRLDPVADGVLLLVTGKELKNFDNYLRLDKEYDAEILFGFYTDTYDILGIPERKQEREVKLEEVEKELEKLKGDFVFSLPPFSSYKVKGKPLFWWALQGKIQEISIPEKKVEIHEVILKETGNITKEELEKKIFEKIEKVKGNFRQEKIKSEWQKIFKKEKEKSFFLLKIKVKCSSGCYIRSIADKLGKNIGVGAVLFNLTRKRLGKHHVRDIT